MPIRDLKAPLPAILSLEAPLPEPLNDRTGPPVHRIPVAEAMERLAGILAETDRHEAGPTSATPFASWEIPSLLAKITVNLMMVKHRLPVTADLPSEETASILGKRIIGSLPVLSSADSIDIANQNDLFRSFLGKEARIGSATPKGRGKVSRITGMRPFLHVFVHAR